LTVFASSSGNAVQGVTVTFSDGGAGGTFGSPTGITGSDGTVATTYTLPPTAKNITITASASGYTSTTFSETSTAPSQVLTATAGNNQTGTVGTILPVALKVTATSGGNPAQGVTVSFTDGGAGGSFGTPTATTDSNGNASTAYTLPPTAQSVTITAASQGYTSATFSETATAPVLALTPTAGNNQRGGTGTTLPIALTVLATSNGSPVQGVSVTFSDAGAGGTFTNSVVTTGTNGTASTSYTLPSTAQTVTITAASSGYTSATFTETADVDALTPTAGNNQSGSVGSTLPTALTATATSNGNPAQGVSVTFSDGGAGGSFGTPIGTTDANGKASTTYTLPPNAQTVTITASSSGYSSATFTETATLQALTATAGNNQNAGIGTTLPTALTVLASSSGSPVQGVTVTFSDGGAGGTFGTPVGVTGSNGMVSTTYTLPGTPETVTITATSPGYTSATFTETATQTVATIALVSGGKQVGTVATALPAPIIMRAKNAAGKTVAGAAITFSDAAAGGSFSPNPAITNSVGQASSTYTLPTKAKVETITASSGSVSGKTTEQSIAGPATTMSILSGNRQTGTHGQALAKKLVVLVTDQYNNNIIGAAVNFTDNGAGGSFSPTNPVTGTNGQASVTYTAGPQAGTVTITASTGSLSPVNFTETIK
jgi:adhesin/invasin